MAQVKSISSVTGTLHHVSRTADKLKFSHVNGRTYTRAIWKNWNGDMFVKIGEDFYSVKYDVAFGLRDNFRTDEKYEDAGTIKTTADKYFDRDC